MIERPEFTYEEWVNGISLGESNHSFVAILKSDGRIGFDVEMEYRMILDKESYHKLLELMLKAKDVYE